MTLAASAFCASGTKRNLSVARSSRAEASETVPTAFQLVPPLIEYCQVPLPLVSAVTAMPSTAPASTSVMRSPPALAMIAETRSPPLVVWSSVMVVSVMAPLLSSSGASLTAVTVMLLLAVAALKAVEPPLVVVFAVRPAVPVVWSQARKVMPLLTVPLQFAFGTKRTKVLAVGDQQPRRASARAAEGVPVQAAVGAPLPAAVGVVDRGDRDAGERAGVAVGDLAADQRRDQRAGVARRVLGDRAQVVGAGKHRRLVDADQRQARRTPRRRR